MDFPRSVDEFHHAYAVEGLLIEDILRTIEATGFSILSNPDVTIQRVQSFGIKDARNLRERAMRKPISNERQFFIIETAHMTSEAQNALLKTFEEPTGFSVFFILLPNTNILIPTLISRMQVLRKENAFNEGLVDSNSFLKAGAEERIEMVAEMLPKNRNEEKNLDAILRFLNALELQLSILSSRNGNNFEDFEGGLKALYMAKKYCMDKGASHKILLEQVALLVPKV
ncbi:MAG: hypothetical protein COV01_01345 [Candidatus Taylorbacteria bacterium CG10_big_fil_rev_8_21_14_0_10_41_48]|uniref:DNA polymerase III subunit delta n=1 Tax=Candidatus Taylorbacteria bacterium CG10_big_fil_rev_8_21_14_0_10_41_48 TaxID=1975024 RepID=A0A2M8LCW5_9BACT|nr:MAG: hypothetical protein COV01_01345 [Candidatus Taylorbacteria bacterium CG10_big_fil_rev_8_21_14_0_10_41_48]